MAVTQHGFVAGGGDAVEDDARDLDVGAEAGEAA